jgi:chromosomal replication initiation ATPase DnaA
MNRRSEILLELARVHGRAAALYSELATIEAESYVEIREADLKAEAEATSVEHVGRVLRLPMRIPSNARLLWIEDVAAVVCTFFRVTVKELRSVERRAKTSHARHLAFFLCRQLSPVPSYPSIAAAFNRDHSTVIAGVRKVEGWRGTYPHVDEELAILNAKLDERRVEAENAENAEAAR